MRKITFLLLFPVTVLAVEPFEISDIRVEGLQRLEAGTVFNYLPLKVGDRVDDQEIRGSIQALFATGFFKDVQLDRDGTVLVVNVAERPSIGSVNFEGNKDLDTDALREAMETAGLVKGRILNSARLDQVEQEIKDQYFARGRYSADIESIVTPLDQNRVAIKLVIDEGRVARIKKISIIGAEAYSANRLRRLFKLSQRRGINPFSKRNQYSKQKLEADLETLRSFYLDRGYYDFKLTSTNVSISPNNQNIFVTASISEGERYVFGDFDVLGDTVVSRDELLSLIEIKPGKSYSRKELNENRAILTDRFADDGYAFANVNPIPDIDRENHVVSLKFAVDPGQRVYVRNINITGNTLTRDEVIRRELRQFEGGWYSAQNIKRSRERLQRLGFFEEVRVETPAVPGQVDQVDMNVTVRERRTGSLLFSLGWSDADGLLVQLGVEQRNLFGTGKTLNFDIDTSEVTDIYEISYINPYHTVNGVSRGFSLVARDVDTESANAADYISETVAGLVRYKFPITETNHLNLSFGLEQVKLTETEFTPPEYTSFIQAFPESTNVPLILGIAKDTRDDIIFPTRGLIVSANLENTFPSSDLEYWKLRLRGTAFLPIWRDLSFRIGAGIGYGDGYGNLSDWGLPFYKNFYAGGSSTVRGYKARSLGPKDSGPDPDPLGGSKRVLANAEILLPVMGAAGSKDKRFGLFVDSGQVYAQDQDIELGDIRYSAGLAFYWYSPVGPLALSYGVPLNEEPGDDVENFQVTLGTLFR
ncbi:MAG: outer membrane protein assembly factor BamA [Pseudomonadota bacterium]|nr:outer membrane protein assembly factor BamA [Pseudomonadota bacterium]